MSTKWKKRCLALAVIIACLAILATGTAAYFVEEGTAYNVITTGALHMELVEETADGQPWPEEGVVNVVPGTTADKVVYVKNLGTVPFFVRVAVEKTITPAPGVEAELSTEHISFNVNRASWIAAEDGYYYYFAPLRAGKQTMPLFTEVVFAPEMGNEYMGATVEIRVQAQAVQSANNGKNPLEALGWSAMTKELILTEEEMK